MSESCRCPYAGLDMRELSLLDPKDLIKILNKAIPVLFKNGGQEGKILQMAALLPDFSGNSGDVDDAIRAIVSWEIRGGELYKWSLEDGIIEDVGKIISCLEKGKTFWIQELIRSLEKQKNLQNIGTWLENSQELNKIAEVFTIKRTVESLLEKAINSSEELKEFDFWERNYVEIAKLVKEFACFRKRIEEAISSLIAIKTEKINGIFKLTTEDSINKFVFDSDFTDYDLIYICLKIAKYMNLYLNQINYRDMADRLLTIANKLDNQDTRQTIVRIACYTYDGLKEFYNYNARDSIYKAYKDVIRDKNFDRIVLKQASKVINFQYKRQGWIDF